ncbi:xylulose kinase [Alicyclobacillus contaminans]|uniref:xylulokinase n=1 Tax=Alicyclobacillus contaminans TaxID=392016 RepID=UPI0003FB1A2D|nr:xylulokinase [Alicyclobacillus contaminans]GMA49851.1 xylulose kinase [Alicyclobacillus contaminans]
MKYVIGIDLGTSAVKVILVNQQGEVCQEVSKAYPLLQPQSGYSEQDPESWVEQTAAALGELMATSGVRPEDVEGLSYSGQMHGLVLLNEQRQVLRNAILWNDTRTTPQCRQITDALGDDLLRITKNAALEGFTLPKILWVMQHEPDVFRQARCFLLPKDYLRFRMTGVVCMEFSDAAGTLMLDVADAHWSKEICDRFEIPDHLCPPLVESCAEVGTLLPEFAERVGLRPETKVFAGGADNACGAVGAGILSPGATLCSIGTSGVVLSYEDDATKDYRGKVHFFNHAQSNAYYSMGVTLAAGFSLSWFRDTFARNESFEALVAEVGSTPIGSNGLLFTPYLVGERTPHADSVIRGSFIGVDGSHRRSDFVRAVMEGITFSLHESIEIFRREGKRVDTIVSIGGGAKNDDWLQMQADIFNATVLKLANEQGPGMGAAVIAACGCGWFNSLADCANAFIRVAKAFHPVAEHVERYRELYRAYTEVYPATRSISERLQPFRR